MAAVLLLGSIPSGLAGTVHSAQGLYIIRFFIGCDYSPLSFLSLLR